MNKMNGFIAAIAIVASVGVSNANAGGFLADTFIRPFSPQLADDADKLNHNLGNPVDHTAAAIAEAYVPGAGQAMEGYWAMQRSGGLIPQVDRPSASRQIAAPPMGNFCNTPVGTFGPGPFNPIGSWCTANTPVGVISGQVVR